MAYGADWTWDRPDTSLRRDLSLEEISRGKKKGQCLERSICVPCVLEAERKPVWLHMERDRSGVSKGGGMTNAGLAIELNRHYACLACTRPWVRALAPHMPPVVTRMQQQHSGGGGRSIRRSRSILTYTGCLSLAWDTGDPIKQGEKAGF